MSSNTSPLSDASGSGNAGDADNCSGQQSRRVASPTIKVESLSPSPFHSEGNVHHPDDASKLSESAEGSEKPRDGSGAKRKLLPDGKPETSPKKIKEDPEGPVYLPIPAATRKPAVVNHEDPSKMAVVLTKSDGTEKWLAYDPRGAQISRRTFDWSCQAHITHLNKWRGQIFRRFFGRKQGTRQQWTRTEERVLGRVVKREALRARSGRKIDWQAATKAFNAKMATKRLVPGQAYAVTKISSRYSASPARVQASAAAAAGAPDRAAETGNGTRDAGKSGGRQAQTGRVKESGRYVPRSVLAVSLQARKFASLDATLALRIPRCWELNEAELDESEEESEEETETEEGSESDESDEDSDDEEGGMRPASNALEGTLVSTS